MDIILLIFLAYRIGLLAEQKGEQKSKWRLILVLGWIFGEMIGAGIGLAIFEKEDTFSWALLGLAFAGSAYFLIADYLSKMPNKNDNGINNIGM